MISEFERNAGCRFLEVTVYGYRALIMENNLLRVMLLLDKGCEIVELNYKKTDTDFLWRSPIGLKNLLNLAWIKKDEQILTDSYTGGWFECFPNVGKSCHLNGALMPQYGEVCYLPWHYQVQCDSYSEVSIKCYVRTIKTPFLVEKSFILKYNEAVLYIEESIKNLSGQDVPFQWGHHPNFGENILDGNCTVRMPQCNTLVNYSAGELRIKVGAQGEWPYVPGIDGNKVDISKVMPKGSGILEVIDLNDLEGGWFELYNAAKRFGIRMEWDTKVLKHNVMWNCCNGDYGYPRYGNTYVMGFVPRSDKTWCVEDSIKNGTVKVLRGGEEKKLWLQAEVIEH